MSAVLGSLAAGTEVEIDGVKKVGEESWLVLRGANGQPGFLPGKTRIFAIRQVSVSQPTVSAYAQPMAGSPASREYSEGTLLTLLDTTTQDGVTWLKIRDALGSVGYIDGGTRFNTGEVIAPNKKPAADQKPDIQAGKAHYREMAKSRIMQGVILMAAGGALYFIASLLTHSATFTMVLLIPVIYGFARLARGVLYYVLSLG